MCKIIVHLQLAICLFIASAGCLQNLEDGAGRGEGEHKLGVQRQQDPKQEASAIAISASKEVPTKVTKAILVGDQNDQKDIKQRKKKRKEKEEAGELDKNRQEDGGVTRSLESRSDGSSGGDAWPRRGRRADSSASLPANSRWAGSRRRLAMKSPGDSWASAKLAAGSGSESSSESESGAGSESVSVSVSAATPAPAAVSDTHRERGGTGAELARARPGEPAQELNDEPAVSERLQPIPLVELQLSSSASSKEHKQEHQRDRDRQLSSALSQRHNRRPKEKPGESIGQELDDTESSTTISNSLLGKNENVAAISQQSILQSSRLGANQSKVSVTVAALKQHPRQQWLSYHEPADESASSNDYLVGAHNFLNFGNTSEEYKKQTSLAETGDRFELRADADVSASQNVAPAPASVLTSSKRNLNASLEAKAKLRDTMSQLHFNKTLSLERNQIFDSSLASMTAPIQDELSLLPAPFGTAGDDRQQVGQMANQLVSVSATRAPNQSVEYLNEARPGANDLASAANELDQRQSESARSREQRRRNSASRAQLEADTSAWGMRKSASASLIESAPSAHTQDQEAPDRHAQVSGSAYDVADHSVVSWTPAAGPAAYRAGSDYRADDQPAPSKPATQFSVPVQSTASPRSEKEHSPAAYRFKSPSSRASAESELEPISPLTSPAKIVTPSEQRRWKHSKAPLEPQAQSWSQSELRPAPEPQPKRAPVPDIVVGQPSSKIQHDEANQSEEEPIKENRPEVQPARYRPSSPRNSFKFGAAVDSSASPPVIKTFRVLNEADERALIANRPQQQQPQPSSRLDFRSPAPPDESRVVWPSESLRKRPSPPSPPPPPPAQPGPARQPNWALSFANAHAQSQISPARAISPSDRAYTAAEWPPRFSPMLNDAPEVVPEPQHRDLLHPSRRVHQNRPTQHHHYHHHHHQQQQQQQQQQVPVSNFSIATFDYPRPSSNALDYFSLYPSREQSTIRPRSPARQAHHSSYEMHNFELQTRAPPTSGRENEWESGAPVAASVRAGSSWQPAESGERVSEVKFYEAGKYHEPAKRASAKPEEAPEGPLTLNLSTHVVVGPNQLFWEAAARESAKTSAPVPTARLPPTNAHTPPQHRESTFGELSAASQAPPMLSRRPFPVAFALAQGDPMMLASSGQSRTNGHAYAGQMKTPQLAAAAAAAAVAMMDSASMSNFQEFAQLQAPELDYLAQHGIEIAPPENPLSQAAEFGPGLEPSHTMLSNVFEAPAPLNGTTFDNQFTKKGAQLSVASPSSVRDPYGWPANYGSEATKALLRINQVAPAPAHLLPAANLQTAASDATGIWQTTSGRFLGHAPNQAPPSKPGRELRVALSTRPPNKPASSLQSRLRRLFRLVPHRAGRQKRGILDSVTSIIKWRPSTNKTASEQLGSVESRPVSQVLSPNQPPKLALIDIQGETAANGSARGGAQSAVISLVDNGQLIDSLESELISQAILYHTNQQSNLGQAPSASMRVASHTIPFQSFEGSQSPSDFGQQFALGATSLYDMAEATNTLEHVIGPPANEPGTLKKQSAGASGSHNRLRQLSQNLIGSPGFRPVSKFIRIGRGGGLKQTPKQQASNLTKFPAPIFREPHFMSLAQQLHTQVSPQVPMAPSEFVSSFDSFNRFATPLQHWFTQQQQQTPRVRELLPLAHHSEQSSKQFNHLRSFNVTSGPRFVANQAQSSRPTSVPVQFFPRPNLGAFHQELKKPGPSVRPDATGWSPLTSARATNQTSITPPINQVRRALEDLSLSARSEPRMASNPSARLRQNPLLTPISSLWLNQWPMQRSSSMYRAQTAVLPGQRRQLRPMFASSGSRHLQPVGNLTEFTDMSDVMMAPNGQRLSEDQEQPSQDETGQFMGYDQLPTSYNHNQQVSALDPSRLVGQASEPQEILSTNQLTQDMGQHEQQQQQQVNQQQQQQYQQQMFNNMRMNQMMMGQMPGMMQGGINIGRPKLPKLMPSINSMASKFRQHLVQTFRPLSAASRWPIMLASQASFMPYPKQFMQLPTLNQQQQQQQQQQLVMAQHHSSELETGGSQIQNFQQPYVPKLAIPMNQVSSQPVRPKRFMFNQQQLAQQTRPQTNTGIQPAHNLDLTGDSGNMVYQDGQALYGETKQGVHESAADTHMLNQPVMNLSELSLNGTNNSTIDELQQAGVGSEIFEQPDFLEQHQNFTDQSEPDSLSNSSQVEYYQQFSDSNGEHNVRRKPIPLQSAMTDVSNNLVASDGTYIQEEESPASESAEVAGPRPDPVQVSQEAQVEHILASPSQGKGRRKFMIPEHEANMTVHHHHVILSPSSGDEGQQQLADEHAANQMSESQTIQNEQSRMVASSANSTDMDQPAEQLELVRQLGYEAERVPSVELDPRQLSSGAQLGAPTMIRMPKRQSTIGKGRTKLKSIRLKPNSVSQRASMKDASGRPALRSQSRLNGDHKPPMAVELFVEPEQVVAEEPDVDYQVIKASASMSPEVQHMPAVRESEMVQLTNGTIVSRYKHQPDFQAAEKHQEIFLSGPDAYVTAMQHNASHEQVSSQQQVHDGDGQQVQTVMMVPSSEAPGSEQQVVGEHVYMLDTQAARPRNMTGELSDREEPVFKSRPATRLLSNHSSGARPNRLHEEIGHSLQPDQYVVVDQPIVLTNQQREATNYQATKYRPSNQADQNQTLEQGEPVVYVSAKPQRVYQQPSGRKRPLKMPKSAQVRLRQPEEAKPGEPEPVSVGAEQRASEPASTHVNGTSTTTTSKPSQLHSASWQDSIAFNSKPQTREEQSKSKARVRWQGMGASGNKSHTEQGQSRELSSSETTRNEQAWLVGGMTHQAYASQPVPTLSAPANNSQPAPSEHPPNHRPVELSTEVPALLELVANSISNNQSSSTSTESTTSTSTTPAPVAPSTSSSRPAESRPTSGDARVSLLKSFRHSAVSTTYQRAPANHRPVASEARTAPTSFRLSPSHTVAAAAFPPVDGAPGADLTTESSELRASYQAYKLEASPSLAADLKQPGVELTASAEQPVPLDPPDEQSGAELDELERASAAWRRQLSSSTSDSQSRLSSPAPDAGEFISAGRHADDH